MRKILAMLLLCMTVHGYAQITKSYEDDEMHRLYKINAVTELILKGDTFYLTFEMNTSRVRGDIGSFGAMVSSGKAWMSLGSSKEEAINTVNTLIDALKQEKGKFEFADGEDTLTVEVVTINAGKKLVGSHSRLDGTFNLRKPNLLQTRSLLRSYKD